VVSGLLHAKAALFPGESAAPGIWEDVQKTEVSLSTANETLISRSPKPYLPDLAVVKTVCLRLGHE